MAVEQPGFCFTLEAAGDLSSHQFKAVVVDSNGRAALPGSDGVVVAGILQNKPSAAGQAASVHRSGISKAVAGGTFNPGTLLMAKGTTGKLAAATAGNHVCAIALEAGADGRGISVLQLDTRLEAAGGAASRACLLVA